MSWFRVPSGAIPVFECDIECKLIALRALPLARPHPIRNNAELLLVTSQRRSEDEEDEEDEGILRWSRHCISLLDADHDQKPHHARMCSRKSATLSNSAAG
jgi:hypothetical protein